MARSNVRKTRTGLKKDGLDAGLKLTINSDDPAYFGGYIAQNYLETAQALGLTLDQLIEIYRIYFPVLQENEAGTWYDQKGRIVWTCSIRTSCR